MAVVKGKIYILIHPMQNGYVKIGKTTRTADERVIELTMQAKTAMAGRYVVAYEEEVENCDLVETKIHGLLQNNRITDDREFFHITVKEAIEKLREVIDKLKNQQKIDFKDMNNLTEWWGNLSLTWKQIFKKYLFLNFEPEDFELIESVNNIVLYSRDEKLRNKICDFLKSKDFQQKIGGWYTNLALSEKKEVKTYLMRKLQKEELEMITNLTELDCSGNILIDNLHPIFQLSNLKKINCSSTNISSLGMLEKQQELEVLDISYTAITSLEALEKLENIKSIKCYHTDISQQEIERFKTMKPNCEVLKNSYNKLID